MRRLCGIFLGLSFLFFFGACNSGQNGSDDSEGKVVKMDVQVSDIMATKMDSYLLTYYKMKDAFVKTDSVAADKAAISLLEKLNELPLNELHSDSTRYNKINSAVLSLKGEVAGLLGEETVAGKRNAFQMISDISYDLVKGVGLKDQTVYREFCPMANNDKGAYWLSNSAEIRNPYFGEKMMTCGEVKETLKF